MLAGSFRILRYARHSSPGCTSNFCPPGYDSQRRPIHLTLFDSKRHVIVDELIYDTGKWIWTGERIHTTAGFSDDGPCTSS
jgi:hypothetical protein